MLLGPQMNVVKHIVIKQKKYESFGHTVSFNSSQREETDKTKEKKMCCWCADGTGEKRIRGCLAWAARQVN